MANNDQYKKEFPYSHKEEKYSWVYKFTTFLEWDKTSIIEYTVLSSNVVLDGTNKDLFLQNYPIGSTIEFLRGEKAKPVIVPRHSSGGFRFINYKNVKEFTHNGKQYCIWIPSSWETSNHEEEINKTKEMFIANIP